MEGRLEDISGLPARIPSKAPPNVYSQVKEKLRFNGSRVIEDPAEFRVTKYCYPNGF